MYDTSVTLLLLFLRVMLHRKNPVKLFEDPTSIVSVCMFERECVCVCLHTHVHAYLCVNTDYICCFGVHYLGIFQSEVRHFLVCAGLT